MTFMQYKYERDKQDWKNLYPDQTKKMQGKEQRIKDGCLCSQQGVYAMACVQLCVLGRSDTMTTATTLIKETFNLG